MWKKLTSLAASTILLIHSPFTAAKQFNELFSSDNNEAQTVEEFLEQDDLWFEILDNKALAEIKSVSLYFEGKAVTEKEKTELLKLSSILTKKMKDNGLKVRSCIECGKTQVAMSASNVRYKHGLASNDELRKLGKQIRVDAFLSWRAPLNQDTHSITMSLVSTKNNEVVWTGNFDLKESPEEITKKNVKESGFGVALGYIGIGGTSNKGEDIQNVTDISVRYYSGHSPSEKAHFAFIGNYFRNFDSSSDFSIQGFGAEARALYAITDDWLSIYAGSGFQFVENKQKISVRTGIELSPPRNAFFTHGDIFVDVGLMYITKDTYENGTWGGNPAFDLTLGVRF
ncbi:conserved hypothetical protein [Vibrio nigripulchritudo SFn27]|uniref:Porin n=1 Tax=Vibrio nigripulchritudo TaxID=28173 RepID=U4K2K9_9VIBR|nr:hypothetical protein [Vibrio nigripulchritudo]CCN82202.1 conserved hypothetical protein [Vibrio nigripulchritudo BLFn1]CCN91759.1 conserved hypothetical protein [Vibrio nigripulchritudo SFn27]CCN97376.1 conserved hypothetical protein [Vibrio nigripulchritudo ENn2]CCO41927.1 conserved hypothetical protein [Vibrio nigripulchritudo SFn135]CCO52231.1 conserved hypothetical protein [Vibrio nigripulchritudo Wn13]